MIKVALLVIVTSSMNFKEMPNVSVTGLSTKILNLVIKLWII